MDKIENWFVVGTTLIIYGIAFIFVERRRNKPAITSFGAMTYKTALLIGMFQVLSIIPGTSRSGATILGAIIIGCSRELAAEFSFFLAIPVMFGVSFLKIITNLELITTDNIIVMLTGMVVAYVVSLLSMKFLVEYVKKHNFKPFGYYRIILGLIVFAYFGIRLLAS